MRRFVRQGGSETVYDRFKNEQVLPEIKDDPERCIEVVEWLNKLWESHFENCRPKLVKILSKKDNANTIRTKIRRLIDDAYIKPFIVSFDCRYTIVCYDLDGNINFRTFKEVMGLLDDEVEYGVEEYDTHSFANIYIDNQRVVNRGELL